MSPAVESSDPHRLTRELIERSGRFVPEAIRADYFREMLHMTVLPEHDELLRILIALQFLSIIIGEVPDRITSEREKLAELLSGTVHAIQAAQTASISLVSEASRGAAGEPPDSFSGGDQPKLYRREHQGKLATAVSEFWYSRDCSRPRCGFEGDQPGYWRFSAFCKTIDRLV